ncbi:GTP-binding protein, partial [Candidatus Micrarchaeota archaeon]|nr:GTP-binding protein [Candidatus Micrarchaeota archaeon]
MAEKEHMNLVFIGHVDAGKSTAVGRVLYDTGALPEQALRKLKEEAEKLGKATFEFAFTMDTLKEERERGVTIDVAHKDFQSAKYYFTIIDAPGHRDFIKNMITGASQADAAVLVVSAKDGVQPQTKEHAFLAKVLGIKQFVILLNKMDAVDYSEDKYKEVEKQVQELLTSMGYKMEDVKFIPVSAYYGDNLAKKSEKMAWFKGPTLLEVLDMFKVPPRPTDKPLRLPIQDVFTITGHGTVPVGRVET